MTQALWASSSVPNTSPRSSAQSVRACSHPYYIILQVLYPIQSSPSTPIALPLHVLVQYTPVTFQYKGIRLYLDVSVKQKGQAKITTLYRVQFHLGMCRAKLPCSQCLSLLWSWSSWGCWHWCIDKFPLPNGLQLSLHIVAPHKVVLSVEFRELSKGVPSTVRTWEWLRGSGLSVG